MINPVAQKQIYHIAERCKEIKPLVVIHCLTYNHEPFLKDALEGFVMQNTNFLFVAVVHEDASTDETAKILKEYADKYPDIILPIFEEENQYSKRDGSLDEIKKAYIEASGAKYVAWCEGDDYWIDPLKLQKQVDFLESHPDYTLCFHEVLTDTNKKEKKLIYKIKNPIFTGLQFYLKRPTQTSAYLYRSEILRTEFAYEVSKLKLIATDISTALICAKYGKLYGIKDLMSVYRLNETGWTHKPLTEGDLWKRINHHNKFQIFGQDIEKASKIFYTSECLQAFIYYLKKGKFKKNFLFFAIKKSPILLIKAIINKIKTYYSK